VLRASTVGPDALTDRLRSAGLTVTSVSPVAPSLEDVFLDVIDRAGSAA
jgi:hypothetical protein